jgi:V/A-type H+-transporting ATPase subunit F
LKYFVIGERELVLAFALVGVQGSVAVNREEALEAFNRITGKGGAMSAPIDGERPKVLILTESVMVMLEQEVFDWQRSGGYPLIVEIPGIQGHLKGRKSLTDSIREAIGVQV